MVSQRRASRAETAFRTVRLLAGQVPDLAGKGDAAVCALKRRTWGLRSSVATGRRTVPMALLVSRCKHQERHSACGAFLGDRRQAIPTVHRLFFRCRPPHVSWFISSVVIDPIQRVMRRRLPANVSNERLEGSTPLIADRNTASAVERVVGGVRVIATPLHGNPCSIFGGGHVSYFTSAVGVST